MDSRFFLCPSLLTVRPQLCVCDLRECTWQCRAHSRCLVSIFGRLFWSQKRTSHKSATNHLPSRFGSIKFVRKCSPLSASIRINRLCFLTYGLPPLPQTYSVRSMEVGGGFRSNALCIQTWESLLCVWTYELSLLVAIIVMGYENTKMSTLGASPLPQGHFTCCRC
jgi:hypothetical protein